MTLTRLFLLLLMASFGLQQQCQDPRDSPEKRLRAVRELAWLDEEWILAFRISSGVRMSAYDDYIDTTRDDDHPVTRAMLPDPCLKPLCGHCMQHYHSYLLNLWPSRKIDQVLVSVIKDKEEVAYILFNGTGSTALNWFSPERVINSSWSDMTSNPKDYYCFTIKGHYDIDTNKEGPRRRFFVFKSYGGCTNDFGWLSVQDQDNDRCVWGKTTSSRPYPAILYSNKKTSADFFESQNVGWADTLAVKVKFFPLNSADWTTC